MQLHGRITRVLLAVIAKHPQAVEDVLLRHPHYFALRPTGS